ncbi:iron-sulfur cluster co-chaperone protein HscB [Lissotriton helveticus]
MLLERIRLRSFCASFPCEYIRFQEKRGDAASRHEHRAATVTFDNDDAVAWRFNTYLLSTSKRLAARHPNHLPPISGNHDLGAWRINVSFLCTDTGLAVRHHHLPIASQSTESGRLNTLSRLTINGRTPRHACLTVGHQFIRYFRAVTVNAHDPALTYSHMHYLSRTGSKGTCSMSKTEGTCWNCQNHVQLDLFFCPTCSAIQPPDQSKDYFQIMNSERTFMVNVQKLQEQYRNHQRLLHPDYFSQKSQKERDLAEKQSSLVNKAYRTLQTPLSRGLYLLKLNGIELGEGTDSDAEMPYIVEIMEINEKLEDALDESEVQDIGNVIDAKYEELTEDVSKAFEKGDVQEAKLLLIKMKYLSNLQEKVKIKIMPR